MRQLAKVSGPCSGTSVSLSAPRMPGLEGTLHTTCGNSEAQEAKAGTQGCAAAQRY